MTNFTKKTGNFSRNKGHGFEKSFCQSLRLKGWEAVTARYESRALDASGVDIVTNAPFNFQLKHKERLQPTAHEILSKMPTNKTPVLVHKKNREGIVISLKIEDFIKLWDEIEDLKKDVKNLIL